MVADVLRRGGIGVHMLGECLPADAVVGFVAEHDADLFCLSCAMDIHLPDTAVPIAMFRRSHPPGGCPRRGSLGDA